MDLLPKVFRTEGKIADFDPSKIYESIIKETGMSEKNTKRITELVVRRIISSGIKFLSGPHIREIVCSILSEQHFEDERKLYTRIGMPLMDYEEILEKGPSIKPDEWINPEKIHHWSANQIAEEYAHLRILENKESKAHLAGDIHINGLNYFVLRPFSQVWDPRFILEHGIPPIKDLKGIYRYKPPKNLNSAIFQLTKWMEIIQNEFYGNQSFNFINTFLAPYLKDLSEGEIIQEIQSLIYNNNLLSLTLGRLVPPITIYSSIPIFRELIDIPAITPDGKTKNAYGDYEEQSNQFFKSLLIALKNFSQKYPLLSFPKHYILVDFNFEELIKNIYSEFWDEFKLLSTSYFSANIPSSFRYKNLQYLAEEQYHNYGILQNISLNLPRYAFTTKDEDKFLELLKFEVILCSNILLKKYNIIKKRIESNHLPLCRIVIDGESLFKLENQSLSLSLVGLNEAVKYLTNHELHENIEPIKLGKKILTELNQLCLELSEKHKKIFILSAIFPEKALDRFSQLDSKNFPKEVSIVSNGRNYTNSINLRKDIDIDVLDRVKIEQDFHKFIHEGALINVSLTDLNRTKINIKEFLSEILKELKISNLKFYV
ncbi:MAG: anaerobic ribonucleoside-triphosphate reductase [Promethearchaeota archaeon]